MTLDLRALHHFLAINRHGGFAKAARDLGISQPTLSRSISLLEQQLSAHLFERSTRGTVITPEGLRLLPHAAMIIEGVERAQGLFESPATETFAQIRIGLSPHLLHGRGASAIGAVLAASRPTHVQTTTGTMESLIDQVKSAEITFALCLVATRFMQNLNRYEGCVFEEIGREVIVPVARAGHPVLEGEASLARLCQFDWAVPYQMSVSYRFQSAFFRLDLPLPKERINTESMALMHTAIEDWGLAGLMPQSLAHEEVEQGKWHVLDAPELNFDYSLAFIRPADLPLSTEALSAIALLRQHMADLPQG
jgi:DNA-binding transcriptional LysR family regulator